MDAEKHSRLESVKLFLNCSLVASDCLWTGWYIWLFCEWSVSCHARDPSIYYRFVLVCILERHKNFGLIVCKKKNTLLLLSGVHF